jgi:two-component system phosphate regulon sensor histidine kinase PhoR
LEDLVNDFLEFTRLKIGNLKLEIGPISVDKELLELFDAYQIKAKEAGIHLEYETDENLPIIQADAKRLRRVFTNLLDNALKFSKPGGKIAVSTLETDKDIVFTIEDEGIGISSKDLPYIFESFFRGAVGGKQKGFGLGLAGVKAIVEGHKGHITVESEPGKGSSFSVSLPKNRNSED